MLPLRETPPLAATAQGDRVNEDTLKNMGPGMIVEMPDQRLPIIAQMAATIFTEKVVYMDDKPARHYAVDQAFLLYGEIAVRLSENDR